MKMLQVQESNLTHGRVGITLETAFSEKDVSHFDNFQVTPLE
jgi:hypothetical protein